MAAGGVPKDPKMARLVMAAKYVLAHKGILLEREKLHLSSMGFSAEELVEVTFAVGQMAGLNLLYVAPRPRSFSPSSTTLHTGTSTSSARASPSRPSSRARARSRTRSTRTSSRRPSSRHNHPFLSVCCCYHRHLPPPSSKHDHHNTARATGTVTRGLGRRWLGGLARSKAKFTILFVASPPTTPARAPHRQRRRRPLGRRRRPPFGWRSRSKRHSLHRRQSC